MVEDARTSTVASGLFSSLDWLLSLSYAFDVEFAVPFPVPFDGASSFAEAELAVGRSEGAETVGLTDEAASATRVTSLTSVALVVVLVVGLPLGLTVKSA